MQQSLHATPQDNQSEHKSNPNATTTAWWCNWKVTNVASWVQSLAAIPVSSTIRFQQVIWNICWLKRTLRQHKAVGLSPSRSVILGLSPILWINSLYSIRPMSTFSLAVLTSLAFDVEYFTKQRHADSMSCWLSLWYHSQSMQPSLFSANRPIKFLKITYSRVTASRNDST